MILSSVNILLGTISPFDGRCGENFAVFGEELTKAYTWILATLILFMPLVILIKILTSKVNMGFFCHSIADSYFNLFRDLLLTLQAI